VSGALLSARALCVGYGGRAILPPIDVTIGSNELWVVAGQNGSGKTTWIKTLLGLLAPVSGSVRHERPRLRLAYLGQRQELESQYPVAVKDVVAMGTFREDGWFRGGSERRRRVARALELTGATELAERPFSELSEGQKQRVLLARVQASESHLAVLDEPTSAMDAGAEAGAWELLKSVQRTSSLSLLVVTHALDLAQKYADRVLRFDRERREVHAGGVELLGAHATNEASS
jgi:zinc transport system ATP-binding protein